MNSDDASLLAISRRSASVRSTSAMPAILRERFDEVRRRAGGAHLRHVAPRVARGEHDDRDLAELGVAAERVDELEAVHVRHLVIADDQRGLHGLRFRERDAAVFGGRDREALAREAVGDVVALRRRIVDAEHALARRRQRAEHQRAHAGRQLLGDDRLDEVVVGAGVEAALEIGRFAERAADQHRHVGHSGVALELLAHRVAVELRHLDVGDHEIGALRGRHR
jgi:hypothetical protein